MNRRELLTTFLATAAIGGNAAEVRAQQRAERQLKALSPLTAWMAYPSA